MNRKLNILIADDEISLRTSLKDILEMEGYNIAEVGNGLDAVEAVKNGNFDVVFLDIRMPIMNGVEAFREISKFNKKIIVIIMTAYALTDLIEEAEQKAFLLIDKPFDIPYILEVLRKIDAGAGDSSSKNKIAVIGENSSSAMVLRENYEVSMFKNSDIFLASSPESFKVVLIEPVSENNINDLHQKLKEKNLNLKIISIVSFDSPILKFLKKENLPFVRKPFNEEDLLKQIT
ncbi:MAG: response regulator [Endomicrobium sp.]|nr:response regulator [Endomicrobium sp.]